jgi:hypothetical protein
MTRPIPYSTSSRPVAFLDARDKGAWADPFGRAGHVQAAGAPVGPAWAALAVAETMPDVAVVYVTGDALESGWQTARLPAGWTPAPAGHYFDSSDPCGRYTYADGRSVAVRRAAPWFGKAGPVECAEAWRTLAVQIRSAWRDGRAVLLASPTGTGQQLWALTVPKTFDVAPLPDDVAALVRSTSPQNRTECYGACYGACTDHLAPDGHKLDTFDYADGRLFYGGLTRELGIGLESHLYGDAANAYAEAHPYARARYLVLATVPWRGEPLGDRQRRTRDWDHLGLLMSKHEDGTHWHAPNLPGALIETWCDAAELAVAWDNGWDCLVVEALVFGSGHRPLDTFTKRLVDLHDELEQVNSLAARAVRAILITTIGGFNSTGRDRTIHVPSTNDLPPGVLRFDVLADGSATYRQAHALTGRAATFARPELASQIWGRAHARMADYALELEPWQLLGMRGDALYLTGPNRWAREAPLPVRVGQLRLKGALRPADPLPRPRTLAELNTLRQAAEAAE